MKEKEEAMTVEVVEAGTRKVKVWLVVAIGAAFLVK
jgi:hypothetical protein